MSDLESTSSVPYVTPQQGDAWAADAARQGKAGTQRLLDVQTTDPPPEVVCALDLQPGEKAIVRRRLILLDERAVELADSYYPATIATGTMLAEAKKIRGGAVTLLGDLGHATAEIVEEITARLPSRDEVSLLKIDKNEPLIVLARLSRDATGAPVEYAINRMVATMTPPLTYRTRTSAQ